MMEFLRLVTFSVLPVLALASAGPRLQAAEAAPEWKLVSKSDGIEIYERRQLGSDLKEFRGVGTFEVAPIVAKRVLDDVKEYPRFMPYVAEARVISTEGQSRLTYQRIAPPFISERDYTVRVQMETRPATGGTTYISRWQTANEAGPAEKPGVTRVKVTNGTWVLEPARSGRATLATYTVFSDCGGSIPAMLFNATGKTAVSKVFTAIRSQAAQPKYAAGE
jgi:ribosome-associated toxin RatA of RatAB toxin-antitoxin module